MSANVDKFMNDDWQDGKTLAECNQNMLAFEIGCDVTFIVDTEEQVRAHSYMLMSRSAILGAKLRAIDKPQKVIPVPGISLDAMKNILTFIYTDEANLDLKMALELILPAHKFGLRNLKTKCFRHLLGEMTSDNVNLTLEKAHQFNEQEIYKRCLFFTHVNAVDVLKTANFRTLCRSCVDDIVCSDDLNADESMVFDALVMWANGECSKRKIQATDVNRREVLGPLLFRIRFAIMDVKEFAKKLTHRDILTQEEKIELYQHFHGQTNTLPERFTKHRRKLYRINDRINMNSFAPVFDIPAIMSSPYTDSSKAVVPRDTFSNKNSFMNNLPVYRVVRFKGISGSWQMKGPDAISFRCTSAIIFRGVQIFGPSIGNDAYTVAISVFDQTDIVRSEVVSAYTKNSKTYDVLLSEPILVPTGRTFTVVTGIKGESTLRGIDGQVYVSSEDVDFEFINSSRSINGTDISMGQIPAILFSKSK